MKHTVRLTVSALVLGGALGACTAANDKPYAHESVRHPTAAERLFGAPPGEPVAASSGSTAGGSLVTAPAIAAPGPRGEPGDHLEMAQQIHAAL